MRGGSEVVGSLVGFFFFITAGPSNVLAIAMHGSMATMQGARRGVEGKQRPAAGGEMWVEGVMISATTRYGRPGELVGGAS